MVNMVTGSIDGPTRLHGVGDLCRHGDQMLNIPPTQIRTGARDMKETIIKHILPSSPCSTQTETTEETLQLCETLWKEPCREQQRGLLCWMRLEDWLLGLVVYYQACMYCWCWVLLIHKLLQCGQVLSSCLRQAYGFNNGVTKKPWIQHRLFWGKSLESRRQKKSFLIPSRGILIERTQVSCQAIY